MKFTALLLLSVAAMINWQPSDALTLPRRIGPIGDSLEARQNFGQNRGGNRGGNGGGGRQGAQNGQNGQGAAAASTTAAAAATQAAAAGGAAAATGGDPQKSLALDPSQIQSNAKATGQAGTPEAGQVASATSDNNFINFCLTQKTTITNGLQTKTGSCNPTIMGRILATDKLVSSKFTFPKNNGNIDANKDFTITMAIKNMVTGNFVNPQTNYFSAPCQVDGSGTVIGHSHVVVEKLSALDQTTVTDPNVFAFFKGLNAAAQGGVLSATVTGGLPAGAYRLSSINTCANHQPVLGAVAQHGSFDDMVYFTVGGAATGAAAAAPAAGAAAANNGANAGAGAATGAANAGGNRGGNGQGGRGGRGGRRQ
jgi:hypothetical protein